jgi:hypothetical protein
MIDSSIVQVNPSATTQSPLCKIHQSRYIALRIGRDGQEEMAGMITSTLQIPNALAQVGPICKPWRWLSIITRCSNISYVKHTCFILKAHSKSFDINPSLKDLFHPDKPKHRFSPYRMLHRGPKITTHTILNVRIEILLLPVHCQAISISCSSQNRPSC